MKDVKELRRENLSLLVEQYGSLAKLNEVLGRRKTDSTLSQIINLSPDTKTGTPKTMGDKIARDIESSLGLEHAWMDSDHSESSEADATLITLNRYNVLAGCNPAGAAEVSDLAVVEKIQVTEEWFNQNVSRYRRSGYDIVNASGDSMEPTINDGDVVIIDKRDCDVMKEGVFCVAYSGGIFLKRVQILPEGIQFLSDNQLYKPIVARGQEIESVKIIGRVVLAMNIKRFAGVKIVNE